MAEDYVGCPECSGTGQVWASYNGAEVEADCPYCGGSGTVLRSAVERDLPDRVKVAVCEYLLSLNKGEDRPFIPPTSINWLGDGITQAVMGVVRGTA